MRHKFNAFTTCSVNQSFVSKRGPFFVVTSSGASKNLISQIMGPVQIECSVYFLLVFDGVNSRFINFRFENRRGATDVHVFQKCGSSQRSTFVARCRRPRLLEEAASRWPHYLALPVTTPSPPTPSHRLLFFLRSSCVAAPSPISFLKCRHPLCLGARHGRC